MKLPVSRRSTLFLSPLAWLLVLALSAAGAFAIGACGGGSSSPSTPSNPPTTSVPAAPNGATITIAAKAVSPKQVQISVGQGVTFVNNDNVVHEMFSDPHPAHTDCPAMDQVGALSPGQSRESGAFTIARTCGFHDHGDAANVNMQGTIIIR